MAKKKSKIQNSPADAVRSAVDQAFQAGSAQFSRERASELVDDLAQAAGRLREALDDLRPITAEDIKALTDKLDAIESRVAKLEKPAPAPAKAPPAAKAPAAKAPAKPAAKRAPAKPAAKRAPAKPAAKPAAKPRATRAAAKPAAKPSA